MAVTRKPGTRLLTGVKELDAKLAQLKIGAANKIARPALTKAARHLLKRVKAAVPPDYKDAKKAFGMTVNAKGGRNKDQQQAKVGAAVGMKAKKVLAKSPSRDGRPGVGLGARNIQWFILGTAERETGSKRKRTKLGAGTRIKTGGNVHRTGRMPAVMPHVVKGTAQQEQNAIIGIMRVEVTSRLAKLAAKK